jgi:hypothetical protein
MTQSPARIALILLFVFIGCFGTAYAAAGMLTALPAPAVGGTCGPSTGSETAFEALARPGSIGAGPEPPVSNVTAHRQWKTFIQQCQSLADRRGLASLAVFVISVAVAAIGLIWVLRRPRVATDGDDRSDGSADWPFDRGRDAPSGLVAVGAATSIAPPAPARWPEPSAPSYGPAPYPGTASAPYPGPLPAWPTQPGAVPYPYSGQPPYPPGPPAYAPPPPYPGPPTPPPPYPPYPPGPPEPDQAAPPAPPTPPMVTDPAHPAPSDQDVEPPPDVAPAPDTDPPGAPTS